MGDMLIRGIPDGLKIELEDAARQQGQSLSSRAVDLMRKGLLFEKKAVAAPVGPPGTRLRAIFEDEGAIDDAFVDLMNEIEAEQKKDFGRPVDFAHDDDPR